MAVRGLAHSKTLMRCLAISARGLDLEDVFEPTLRKWILIADVMVARDPWREKKTEALAIPFDSGEADMG